MEHVFKDLRTAHAWAWVALVLCAALVAVLILSPALSAPAQGWVAIAAYVALCVFFWPSILKAAHENHHHLLTVCVWTFFLVILGIATTFYSFFQIAGDKHLRYDKLLNVVPVFVAIWAAAVGWLIHFRLTTKAHRTNNAFSIIMEMRKSAEYLKRSELVARHFPPNTAEIPAEYHRYFPAHSIRNLCDADPIDPRAVEMAEAVLAMKYLLNYFEFMAVGIEARDLDEELLYDTISTTVVKLHARSISFIEHTCSGNGGAQALAYSALKPLVARWKHRLALEEAAVSGQRS